LATCWPLNVFGSRAPPRLAVSNILCRDGERGVKAGSGHLVSDGINLVCQRHLDHVPGVGCVVPRPIGEGAAEAMDGVTVQVAAVQNVLQQAEALSVEWAA
jgi:hypothetical protein